MANMRNLPGGGTTRAFEGKEFDALPKRVRYVLNHPWVSKKRLGPVARRKMNRFLNRRGLITPNFSWREARCKDHANTPVPRRLRRNARRHAWNLEKLRHEVGNKGISFLSWYRTPVHNRAVGGASQSRHMQADATDLTAETIRRIGRARLMAAANRVFSNGGVGDYPSGAVHVDSRGFRARWSSY